MSVSRFANGLLLNLTLIACVASIGCAFSRRVEVPRTGWEQILSTEAIDRALAQLEWPDLSGQSVFVQLGAPASGKPPVPEGMDTEYLRRGVEVALVQRGAVIIDDDDEADFVMNVLIGAMGLDTSGRFLGIQGSSGGLIPFTIPELAIYKRTKLEGFAKAEIALLDYKNGRVVHRSGPVQGTTYRQSTIYFFIFSRSHSVTSRLD
jgi:hypothetical protein